MMINISNCEDRYSILSSLEVTLEGETFFPPLLICKDWLQVFANTVHFWLLLLRFSFDGLLSLSTAKAAVTCEYGFDFILLDLRSACVLTCPSLWCLKLSRCLLLLGAGLLSINAIDSAVSKIELQKKRMRNPESWTGFLISILIWISKDILFAG